MSQTVGWIKAIKNILIELRNRWMWVCLVLAIAVSRICWYGIQQAYVIYPDSTQYIAFDTSAVLQGNLRAAEGRPPVYGIFLDFMQLFFGEGYLEATKIVQVLVSILSLYIFFKLLGRIGIGTPWREICVFLYGVTPAVVGWENAILTESFSISGSIFFLYGVVLYIQEHRLRDGIFANLLALVLAFLRPQFMLYLALLLVFLPVQIDFSI